MNQTFNQRVRELKVTVRTKQTASQASKNNFKEVKRVGKES